MYYAQRMFAIKRYVPSMQENRVKPSRRDEYTEATRNSLLTAGREAFARDGYQAAGVESISRAARVTRGAFYHHFEDKKALFDAVVVGLQTEAAAQIEAKARKAKQVWDRLSVGIDAYLDVCTDPAYGRIVIQEGPAVLGSARFGEIEEAHPMALLTATLTALKRQGQLDFDDIDLLSRVIDAVVCKVALTLLDADDARKLRTRGHKLIASLLSGLRRP